MKTGLIDTGHFLKFAIGQTVYIITDDDQRPRIITGIVLRPSNSVIYTVAHGTSESSHYAMELSAERDIIKATS